jgi:hypothetical protein
VFTSFHNTRITLSNTKTRTFFCLKFLRKDERISSELPQLTYSSLVLYFWGFIIMVYAYFTLLVLCQCYILRKFKGPIPLPVVGNVYEASVFSYLKHMSKLRKRYGKIFSFIAIKKPMLVVCDPVVVRRVLSDSKIFIKGDDYTNYFSITFVLQ